MTSHIRPEIQALADRGNVTLAEWRDLRMNSYEQELLIPKLTDEALIYTVDHMAKNCQIDQRRPFTTYDNAMIGLIVPELIRRLEPLR